MIGFSALGTNSRWTAVLALCFVNFPAAACSSTTNGDAPGLTDDADEAGDAGDARAALAVLDSDCTAVEEGADRGTVCVLLASCGVESAPGGSTNRAAFFAACSSTSDTEVECACESPGHVITTFAATDVPGDSCAAMVNLCRGQHQDESDCVRRQDFTDSSCRLSEDCHQTSGDYELSFKKSSTTCSVQTDDAGNAVADCICEGAKQRLTLSVPLSDGDDLEATCSNVDTLCQRELGAPPTVPDCAEDEGEHFESEQSCRRQWDCVTDSQNDGEIKIHRDVVVECDNDKTPGECSCVRGGYAVFMPRPEGEDSACDAVLQACSRLEP